MTTLTTITTDARKFLAAAAGAVAVAISDGLLSGTAEKWTTGLIAVATAAVVYLVPNSASPPAPIA
jgi:hypothetical protein